MSAAMPARSARSASRARREPASPWAARRRLRAGHALKREAVILAAARAFRAARLPQHLARRPGRQPRGHQAHTLFICAQQGGHAVRVLPGGARADPGHARGMRRRAGAGARTAVRLHPRIRRGHRRRLRLVHAARRGPAPRRRHEPPHQTTQGGHRPAHARAHRSGRGRRLDPRLRHQDDGVRARGRAQLDGPLVSRRRDASSPPKSPIDSSMFSTAACAAAN